MHPDLDYDDSTHCKKIPGNIHFHWHLAYFLIGLMLLLGAVSTWYFQSLTERLLLMAAGDRFENSNQNAANRVRELYANAARTTALMAEQRLMRAEQIDRVDFALYLPGHVSDSAKQFPHRLNTQ